MPAEVAIVVVTYNHADEIDDCLRGALDQDADQPVEVVVVDNASSDATADRAGAHGGVRLICEPVNGGFAAGVNRGVEATAAPWVLLLNPDCVMEPGCVRELLAHMDGRPLTGAASALLRNADGTPQLFARREVSLGVAFWNFTEVGRRLDERRFGEAHRKARRYALEWEDGPARTLEVDCPAAACVLLRREDLGRPAMREDLPLFFNDADLFRRLRSRGRVAEVVPAAGALHGYGTSHRRLDADRRWAEFLLSLRAYVRPWWPRRRRAALWLLLAADAAVALVLAKAGRGRPTTVPLARGALGALGLPGGAEPWLSSRPVWARGGAGTPAPPGAGSAP